MPEIETIEADIQPMFSADAIRYGDLLFVSGCVPCKPDGSVVGVDDLAAQTRQTLDNLGTVLRAGGSDFEHVIKTTVYITDISRKSEVSQIRRGYFGTRPPASTMVEISALDGADILIEIDAIAAIPA
jgi:2-iminobutanoate/2-iminopropanoate deaminase